MHLPPRRAAGGCALLAGLLALIAACASCRGLLGPTSHSAGPDAAQANRLCYECHIDFRGEPLAETHEQAGVACARCHGTSLPHREDEVRKTPPDSLPRGRALNIFCLTCHDPVRHLEWPAHRAEAALPKGTEPRTCTACHGEHKLMVIGSQAPTP